MRLKSHAVQKERASTWRMRSPISSGMAGTNGVLSSVQELRIDGRELANVTPTKEMPLISARCKVSDIKSFVHGRHEV